METIKLLGKLDPAATTETVLYTVPSAKGAVVKVTICNRTGSAITYRLSHSVNGAATADTDFLAYDKSVAANTSELITNISMSNADVIRVYASAVDMSFVAHGVEFDQLDVSGA